MRGRDPECGLLQESPRNSERGAAWVWVSGALVVPAAVVAFALCCTTQDARAGKTIITYTRWGDPSELDSTRELIAQFEKENPDIVVEPDVVSWEQYWQKIKTAVITKTAQDVWLLDPRYVEQYAAGGYLLDLMPFIERDPTFDINDYWPYSFDPWTLAGEGTDLHPVPFGQGKLFAFVRDYNMWLLYYNRDHFDALGMSYPDETWTWDDLVRAAQKLTLDFDGDGMIDQYGFGGLAYEQFAQVNGGLLIDVDRRKSSFSCPAVVEAVTFCRDLIHKYGVHPPPGTRLGGGDSFNSGKVSMTISGVWSIRWHSQCEYLWDIAPIPAARKGEQPQRRGEGVAHGIYSGTRHPEEALRLVKFLSSDISQRELARSGTSIPVLKRAIFADQAMTEYRPEFLQPFDRPPKSSYHVIFDHFRNPERPVRFCRGFIEYNTYVTQMLEPVWRNARSPAEACRMIDEKTNGLLAEEYGEVKP